MLRRRHRPIHYRPRPRLVSWLVTIVVVGLAVGAALHYGSEPFGVASSPRPPVRVATFTGRAEASGPVGLRIEPASLVLFGIDPPSAGINCGTGDCTALARDAMAGLIGEREIHCVSRPHPDGRPAATCFLPDGSDLAAALVGRGWALTAPDAPLYRAEEERARAAGLGIWARPSEAQVPAAAPASSGSPPVSSAAPDVPAAPPIGPGGYVPPED